MATKVPDAPLYFSSNASYNVPSNINAYLQPWHLNVVRFLYNAYSIKKLHGVILNHEISMNGPLQIAAFLSVYKTNISFKNYALIICSRDCIPYWHYNMVTLGEFSTKILLDNSKENLKHYEVLIVSNEENKLVKMIEKHEFQFVIIDSFDCVALKQYVTRLKGEFKIGITSRNFYLNRDQKLLWTMLNWANKDCVGKFKTFCELDNDHLENFRNPYQTWWHRLTWPYFDLNESPDMKDYEETIKTWSVQQNLIYSNYATSTSKKRKTITKRSKKCNNKEKFELKSCNDSSSSDETSNKRYPKKKIKGLNSSVKNESQSTETSAADKEVVSERYKQKRHLNESISNSDCGQNICTNSDENSKPKIFKDSKTNLGITCNFQNTPYERMQENNSEIVQSNQQSTVSVDNAIENSNSQLNDTLENVSVIEETDLESSDTVIDPLGGNHLNDMKNENCINAMSSEENLILNELFNISKTEMRSKLSVNSEVITNVKLIESYEKLMESLNQEIILTVDESDQEILNSLVKNGPKVSSSENRLNSQENNDFNNYLPNPSTSVLNNWSTLNDPASDFLLNDSDDIDPVPKLALSDSDDNGKKNPILDRLFS